MLQVVILVGGRGKRLKTLTETVPKPMIMIGNRPFLEHQLDWIRRQGFDRILMLTGYLAKAVEGHFGNGRRWGLSIRYSREPTPLGTAGALKAAERSLEDHFLVLNGDTFLPIDYGAFTRRFLESDQEALVAIYDNKEPVAPNNLSVSSGGLVSFYNKNSGPELTHVDAGAYAFHRKVLARIPPDRPVSMEEFLLPALVRERALAAYPVPTRYYDIGTPERLEIFRKACHG